MATSSKRKFFREIQVNQSKCLKPEESSGIMATILTPIKSFKNFVQLVKEPIQLDPPDIDLDDIESNDARSNTWEVVDNCSDALSDSDDSDSEIEHMTLGTILNSRNEDVPRYVNESIRRLLGDDEPAPTPIFHSNPFELPNKPNNNGTGSVMTLHAWAKSPLCNVQSYRSDRYEPSESADEKESFFALFPLNMLVGSAKSLIKNLGLDHLFSNEEHDDDARSVASDRSPRDCRSPIITMDEYLANIRSLPKTPRLVPIQDEQIIDVDINNIPNTGLYLGPDMPDVKTYKAPLEILARQNYEKIRVNRVSQKTGLPRSKGRSLSHGQQRNIDTDTSEYVNIERPEIPTHVDELGKVHSKTKWSPIGLLAMTPMNGAVRSRACSKAATI